MIVWTVRDLTAEDHARLAASAQAVVLKGGTGRLIEELRTNVTAPSTAAPAPGATGGP